jgi:hypothetical protein
MLTSLFSYFLSFFFQKEKEKSIIQKSLSIQAKQWLLKFKQERIGGSFTLHRY